MITARLTRIATGSEGTFGALTINGNASCVTLEPPWKMNAEDVSCIPAGQYICKPYSSKRYPNVYQIMEVHGRTVVLIHIGNRLKNTEGCVLLGSEYGELRGKAAILNSTKAVNKFLKIIGDNEFQLTITEHY